MLHLQPFSSLPVDQPCVSTLTITLKIWIESWSFICILKYSNTFIGFPIGNIQQICPNLLSQMLNKNGSENDLWETTCAVDLMQWIFLFITSSMAKKIRSCQDCFWKFIEVMVNSQLWSIHNYIFMKL